MKNKDGLFPEPFVDAVCRISVAYLSIPVVLFFLSWFKWLPGVLAAAMCVYAVGTVCSGRAAFRLGWSLDPRQAAVAAVGIVASMALAVVSFPALDAIPLADAVKHGTILTDLARQDWPVVYIDDRSEFSVLRYSLAYYLVPAGIAKLAGREWINYALLAWTAGGVFLFLMMAASLARKVYSALFNMLAAGLFSGLGILYVLATNGEKPFIWYATFAAWARNWGNHWLIGSHTFELAWSPQHALPAWLAAGIVYFCHRKPWFDKAAVPIAAVLLFWSPFVAVSFMALVALLWTAESRDAAGSALAQLKGRLRSMATVRNLCALALGALVLAFLTADSQKIPVSLFTLGKPAEVFATQFVLFVALEFGVLVAVVKYAGVPLNRPAAAALVILLAFLFTSVGAASDLQMRGSQLPFTILMFLALQAVAQARSPGARLALLAVLGVGMAGSLQEVFRKPLSMDVDRDNGRFEAPIPFANFGGHEKEIRPQYLAVFPKSSRLAKLLEKPHAAYVIGKPVDYGLGWTRFGEAVFNEQERSVASPAFCDAALVSDDLALAPGLYQLDFALDWDVAAKRRSANAAHISLHGKRMLIPIDSSRADNKRFSVVVESVGQPIRVSFGLGGWSTGKGFVRLKEFSVSPITGNFGGDPARAGDVARLLGGEPGAAGRNATAP